MKLHPVAERLIEAQNSFNSQAYTACFTESAIVHDEGKTHRGKGEILAWIEESNEKYRSVMKAMDYEESGSDGVITAEVSGTFPGSPAVLKFHLGLKNDLIESLKVTG